MSAVDDLLKCEGNPVQFFTNVREAREEVEALRADLAYVREDKNVLLAENEALQGTVEKLKEEICYAEAERWISVDERLPEQEKDCPAGVIDVLLWYPNWKCVEIGSFHFASRSWCHRNGVVLATHWRPLPAGPEEEAK